MPNQITITDHDIQNAEQLLLPNGGHFDTERQDFIKNLKTIDLQACPGSGKTTCLIAKLLIIGKHLPFEGGRGILVLSHTNRAIDEIKDRIFVSASQLFNYPNYVGTIQSFVDKFLAIPFYQQRYGHLPYRIDDEIFNEKIWQPPEASGWLNSKFNKDEFRQGFLRNLRFDINGNLVSGPNGQATKPRLTENSTTYKAIHEMRKKLLEKGYLCFDDAYHLAERYLMEFPKIINLIQRRFAFVFMDEMQDTDVHQMRVLDKLFPPDGQSVVQRIGDQNQAIYSRNVKAENVWTPRPGHLTLCGSRRLSESVASAIKNISLKPQDLVGNNQRENTKPKIILFDDSTIKEVPPKFAELVVSHNLHKGARPIFKAIGWRKNPPDGATGAITIGSYFDGYDVATRANRIDFENLGDYLESNRTSVEHLGLGVLQRNILTALVKLLRLADVKKPDGKPHTVTAVLSLLRDSYGEKYSELRLNLYKWACAIYGGTNKNEEIKEYFILLLKDVFSADSTAEIVQRFLTWTETTTGEDEQETVDIVPANVFCYPSEDGDIHIDIETIHGIKGETHTATLYLETYYYGQHECERLIEQLKGNRVDNCGVRVKESLKMAYVGMSRPTNLLCVAAYKSHIPENELPNLESNWEIVSLCGN